MLEKRFLDILACPACKSEVEFKHQKIVCKQCGRRYPLREDIPVMLIEEGEDGDGENT